MPAVFQIEKADEEQINTHQAVCTTKDFDGRSVSRVFSFNERSHANDKKISKAGYESNNPDKYSEDITSQEVLKWRNAVSQGPTYSDMGSIGAVSKGFEITKVKGKTRVTLQQWRGKSSCVRYTLHWAWVFLFSSDYVITEFLLKCDVALGSVLLLKVSNWRAQESVACLGWVQGGRKNGTSLGLHLPRYTGDFLAYYRKQTVIVKLTFSKHSGTWVWAVRDLR